MAEERDKKEKGALEQFLEQEGNVFKAAEIAQGMEDERGKESKKAEKEAKEFIYLPLAQHKILNPDNITSPDGLTDEYIRKYLPGVQRYYSENASQILTDKLEDVIKDLDDSTLELLALNEEVTKRDTDHKYQKVIQHAAEARSYRELEKRIKDGIKDKSDKEKDKQIGIIVDSLGEEQRKGLRELGAKGAAENQRKTLDPKYSNRLREIFAEAAADAVRMGAGYNKYIPDGLSQGVKDSEKALAELAGKGKGLREYIHEVVGKLAKGSAKEHVLAKQLLYNAYKEAHKK